MKSTVQLQYSKDGEQITVRAPYEPTFPAAAKKLGGRWNAADKSWSFDARDIDRVRNLCVSTYGTDGTTDTAETVTVRVVVGEGGWYELCGSLFLYGRLVARAYGRDSGVKLGDGVVVLEGKFGSGGSMKNWRTVAQAGTVFELRDVPRQAYEANGIPAGLIVGIVDGKIDRAALQAEREKLVTRLAEIDDLLK